MPNQRALIQRIQPHQVRDDHLFYSLIVRCFSKPLIHLARGVPPEPASSFRRALIAVIQAGAPGNLAPAAYIFGSHRHTGVFAGGCLSEVLM